MDSAFNHTSGIHSAQKRCWPWSHQWNWWGEPFEVAYIVYGTGAEGIHLRQQRRCRACGKNSGSKDSPMIRFLLFLAARCRKLAGFFGRLETDLLTLAEKQGWQIPEDDIPRIRARQFALFNYRKAKQEMKNRRIKV